MSTTIDQNVVEMRFDNQHFERNVATSMSTLDKLKQNLRFDGATKGIESVGTATEAMSVKVSHAYAAMQAQIVRWATTVTQSVEKAFKALTIDPITTGFSEYETQINATQTILANTQSKGSTIDDVNRALEELNKYADMTIYNFTEMTKNIGTFTAAGIDLETSVNAIQGIANLAAVSGSTSQQASTAMYQLSQALSTGTVRLMDWNSVVNAGMGGQIFQDALKETSEALGTGAEAAIKASGSFRESLSDGWLTAEVLTETLKKFTSSGANEYVAKYTELSVDAVEAAVKEGEAAEAAAKAQGKQVDAIDHAAEALAKKSGKNKEEIKDILEFAKNATDAATKVKTFTQLWDVLKESAQSGWSQTWKIIVGDFEKAKELLTPLADTLTGFINKMSDARNRVLTVALAFTDPIKTMMEKLNGAGLGKIKDTIKAVGDLSDKLKYYQDIVTKVWRGDFNNVGDNPDRYDLLEKAGYDHRVVQDLVNKGYEYKLTVDDIEASYKKFGLTLDKTKPSIDKNNSSTKAVTATTVDASEAIQKLSDEKLKDAGLTKEEIALYRALEKEAERLGISVFDLAEKMSEADGRTLLIDSFKNFGDIIVGVGKAAKDAWNDIFNPPSLEYMGVRLHSALRSLKEFSESIRITDKDAGKLNDTGLKIQRIFKGVFAAVDIVTTILGGGFRLALKTISKILSKFDLDILGLTANLGDAIVSFRDWLFEQNGIVKALDELIDKIPDAIQKVKDWYAAFKETPAVKAFLDAIEKIKIAFDAFSNGDINLTEFAQSLGTNFANALKPLGDIAVYLGKSIGGALSKMWDSIFDGMGSFDVGKLLGDIIRQVATFGIEFVDAFMKAFGLGGVPKDFLYNWVDGFISQVQAACDAIAEFTGSISTVIGDMLSELPNAIQAVKDWLDVFKETPAVKEFVDAITAIATTFRDLFNGDIDALDFARTIDVSLGRAVKAIPDIVSEIATGISEGFQNGFGIGMSGIGDIVANALDSVLTFALEFINGFAEALGLGTIPDDFIQGFADGIANGVSVAWDAIVNFATSILDKFREVLGIHSPSDETAEDGKNFILGFIEGLSEAAALAWEWIKEFGSKCLEALGQIDWGSVFAGILTATMVVGLFKIIGVINTLVGAIDKFADGFKSIGGFVEGIKDSIQQVANSISSYFKTKELEVKSKAMINFAIALGILAAAIWVLAQLDWTQVAVAVVALAAVAGILVWLSKVSKDLNSTSGAMTIAGTLIGIAGAVLILAYVAKMASEIPKEGILNMIAVFVILGVAMAAMTAMTKLYNKDSDGIAKTLISMSLAMLLLIGVAKLAGSMAQDEFYNMVKVFAILELAILGLVSMTRLYSTQSNGIAKTLTGMSVAMGILVLVAKFAGNMTQDEFYNMVKVFAILELAILGLVSMTAIYNNKADNAAKTLLGMAAAMGILVLVGKLAGTMSPDEMVKMVAVLAILELAILGLVGITHLTTEKELQKVGSTIFAMAGAIAIISMVALLLGLMSIEHLTKGVVAVGILGSVMALMIWATRGASECKDNIMMMAIAIGVMAAAVIALSFIPWQTLLPATLGLALLMGMFAVMAKASSNIQSSMATLIVMTVAIGVLAGAIWLLSGLPIERTIGSAVAMSVLMLALAGVMRILGSIAKDGLNALGGVIMLAAMAVPMAAFVGILALMSGIDDALNNVGVISALMLAMSGVLAVLALVSKFMTTAVASIIGLTALAIPMLAFVGVLALMNMVPNANKNATVLITLMVAMTGVLAVLALISTFLVTAIAGVIALTALAIPMVAFVGILALMSGVENATANVELMILLMSSLTGMMVKLALVGPLALIGVAALTGLLAVITAFGVLAVAIGALMEAFPDLQTFLDTGLPLLEQLAGSIGKCLGNFIGGIAEGLSDSLVRVIADVMLFINGLKTASLIASTIKPNSFDGVVGLVEALIAMSIGSLVESLTSAVLGESSMETFKNTALEFVDLVKAVSDKLAGSNIDQSSIQSLTACGTMFTELQNALPKKGGLLQDIVGEADLAGFGASCKAFANCMIEVNEAVSQEGFAIKSELISQLVAAGERFNELQNALPKTGGVLQDLAGTEDLAGFGAACKAFTTEMIKVNEAISAEGFVVQSDRIAQLVTAGQKFNELQTALPKKGGVLQDLVGSEDLAGFGASCSAFATVMIAVNTAVSQEGFSLSLTAVENLKQAGLKFNELQNALPKTGGWWEAIAGKSDLEDFGKKIEAFGTAMANYSTSVAAIEFEKISASLTAATDIKTLVSSIAGLDTSGMDKFVGAGFDAGCVARLGTAMSTYAASVAGLDVEKVKTSVSAATKLKTLIASLASLDASGINNFKVESIGTSMGSYAGKVKDLNPSIVSSSISAANKLKTFIASLANLDPSGIGNFKLKSIADQLKTYGSSIGGFNAEKVGSSITAANKLKVFISSLSTLNTAGVGPFKSAIEELSTVKVSELVKAFEGASSKLASAGSTMMDGLVKGMRSKMPIVKAAITQTLSAVNTEITSKLPIFDRAGTALITKLAGGISNKRTAVKSAISSCIVTASSGIRAHYTSFQTNGAYLGSGLVVGINSKKTAAYNAGYALGQAAVQGEKDGQKSKSPSKETILAGHWLGEGLIIGMDEMGRKVYRAGSNLGQTAASTISTTVARISDMVNSDIDTQPTIRPVVDLSNVRTGVAAIGSMMNMGSTLGVTGNIRAISSMMNSRSQNGVNDDVVSAIDKLSKRLDNIGNTTYQVNGVTYDDGSNISDAVKTLVRAARIERRV